MQMLGVQVLFGFQLQGLFQETFLDLPPSVRMIDTTALAMTISVVTLLLAVPCQHRIVEQGEASLRIFRLTMRYANYALLPLAAVISCDIYAATRLPFGGAQSVTLASTTFLIAVGAWYGAAMFLRQHGDRQRGDSPLQETKTSLHAKIEQLLTEARVILPGAQALLGFQLIVLMTKAFAELPAGAQRIHLIALMSLVLSVVGRKDFGRRIPGLISDGGRNVAMPPSWQYHALLPVSRAAAPGDRYYDVFGPLCHPGDLLFRTRWLPDPEPGDLLAIMDAGAYFIPNQMNFSNPRPAVVVVTPDEWTLIRARESFDDVVRLDQFQQAPPSST